MDLAFSASEQKFREEIRAWIAGNLPPNWGTPAFPEPKTFDERLEFSRGWERTLSDAGWAGLSWPKEYGGRGATLIESVIFSQEMARAKAPAMLNVIGIGMAGPSRRDAHGADHLP